MASLSAIGILLRQHRKNRGMSQLELANAANSTSRYISFIETGRSRPGKEVVLRLASALTLTMRDTNALLLAAGLQEAFDEKPLTDDEMKPVNRIIEKVLKNHEPFPAWAIGSGLRFLSSNSAAEKVFPNLVGIEPKIFIEQICGPSNPVEEKERAYIIHQTLNGLKKEAFHYPHPAIPELISQVEEYAKHVDEPPLLLESPIMCPTIMVDGKEVRTLSTAMRFDKGVNVTMSEIRIELIYPADDESEEILRSLQP